MKVKVVRRILEANEKIAEENRKLFKEKGIFTINLMSGPGAGKTSLLVRTIEALKDKVSIGVIEGDITGTDDAERINALDVPVVQINTEGACHLDADMIREALDEIALNDISLLFIENVGNLVCPAEFNVGENMKAMVLSISEGDDKPLKYPLMFQESGALVINKTDLLPHTDVDIEKIKRNALSLNSGLEIFEVSCRTGAGLPDWTGYLTTLLAAK
ncbi:[NiFe] hydrogenase nickel incorporation-associated protein HypB [hydrothermal vent metagenome]|uniref:[NiFe] hydrogenase nickel incorporation-associated protein HypB n=1 Tax=hydrothermal vent metagenome TaxID=652676 RepID=A0A3B1D424_9ZZZZ